MRVFLIALAVALFQHCDCQSGDGPPNAGEADEAAEADDSATEDDPTGDAAGGNGPPQQAGSNRRFLTSGVSVPGLSICPKYSLYRPPTVPMCPRYASKKCPVRVCWRFVKLAVVCRVPLLLNKPFWYKGLQCRKENEKCHTNNNFECKCVTKVCWMRLRRLVKVYRKDLVPPRYVKYLIVLYWRRPCGCDCRGKRKPTPAPWTPNDFCRHFPPGQCPFDVIGFPGR